MLVAIKSTSGSLQFVLRLQIASLGIEFFPNLQYIRLPARCMHQLLKFEAFCAPRNVSVHFTSPQGPLYASMQLAPFCKGPLYVSMQVATSRRPQLVGSVLLQGVK